MTPAVYKITQANSANANIAVDTVKNTVVVTDHKLAIFDILIRGTGAVATGGALLDLPFLAGLNSAYTGLATRRYVWGSLEQVNTLASTAIAMYWCPCTLNFAGRVFLAGNYAMSAANWLRFSGTVSLVGY